jgi:hypothetical protein
LYLKACAKRFLMYCVCVLLFGLSFTVTDDGVVGE